MPRPRYTAVNEMAVIAQVTRPLANPGEPIYRAVPRLLEELLVSRETIIKLRAELESYKKKFE
jgi:hypothetical protein